MTKFFFIGILKTKKPSKKYVFRGGFSEQLELRICNQDTRKGSASGITEDGFLLQAGTAYLIKLESKVWLDEAEDGTEAGVEWIPRFIAVLPDGEPHPLKSDLEVRCLMAKSHQKLV